MNALRARFRSWLRAVRERGRVEMEMEEEIRFHLEARAADLVREGAESPAGDAASAAGVWRCGVA